MISSFGDQEAEKIFNGEKSRSLPSTIQRAAYRKLHILHNSKELKDLTALPGNRLEKLIEKRKGQYSICINDQYRVYFIWQDGDALGVEIVDYH